MAAMRTVADSAVEAFVSNDPQGLSRHLVSALASDPGGVRQMVSHLNGTYGTVIQYEFRSAPEEHEILSIGRGSEIKQRFEYAVVTTRCPADCYFDVTVTREGGAWKVANFILSRQRQIV